jgi:hypothetical protein
MNTSVGDQRSVSEAAPGLGGGAQDFVQRFGNRLEVWRAKVDELEVQAALAGLEAGDEVRERLVLAENVFLAARSKLSVSEIETDEGLRHLLEGLAGDLRDAFQAAQAVLERSRRT